MRKCVDVWTLAADNFGGTAAILEFVKVFVNLGFVVVIFGTFLNTHI